ncbi:MAG: class I SAM-dependent methyltransferase, partial [Alphaproteobacteria bacterium]|nr:class I SAM-dependent methyltransferase [Alphaproteobacteria bacterium]
MTNLTQRYDSGEYLASSPDWHAYDSPWKAAKVHEFLVSHNIAPQSVCDVGCGAGEVLVQLQKRMDKTTQFLGFDTAQTAIDLCKPKENPNLKFQLGDFLADSSDRYDLILALDVFEHVPDYLGFLAKLSKRADKFVFHIPLDINASTV